MNDIPEASDVFSFILYADDTTLKSYITVDKNDLNLNPCFDALNLELSKVSDWLAVNMLSLNIGKTKYLCFHSCQKKYSAGSTLPNSLWHRNQTTKRL